VVIRPHSHSSNPCEPRAGKKNLYIVLDKYIICFR
jgi:hypothetical protein